MAITWFSSRAHFSSLLAPTVSNIITLIDWCFVPTFVIFCVVSFLLTKMVFNYSQNIWFRIATFVICEGMCLAYFLVATSNPGIVTEEDFADV